MKFNKTILAAILTLSMSGCATVIQGTEDTVNVRAIDAVTEDTKCTLSSSEGTWYTQGKRDTVTVERDWNDLTVHCENETQEGIKTVESDTQFGWVLVDILVDFCIISCPIDASTGAMFSYPSEINVEMESKVSKDKVLPQHNTSVGF